MTIEHHVNISAQRTIHVAEHGSGPAVLLLHGIPGSGASWTDVVERLAVDHRVLVPDLLGFGPSTRSADPDALHARGQAASMLEVLDALGVQRALLIGHDFGGPIALTMLALRPSCARGIGLLATNTFIDTPIPFPLKMATWPVIGRLARAVLFSRASLRMMLRRGVGTAGVTIDVKSAVGDREQARAIATIFGMSLVRLEELYAPIQRALTQVAVPSFVAWGDRDPFFSVEQGQRTASALAGARFELLAGAGHFLPVERPAEIASLITELAHATASDAAA